jgi:ketosteroid isomerase-like protein
VTEAEELVRRLFDAHNSGGGDALLEIYDDIFDSDFEFRPATVGTFGSAERSAYRGREGMERYYHDRAEAFDGGEVHIRSLEPAGDAVIAHARSTARGRASGATVEEDIALVYWSRDGRLIRGEVFRSARDARQAAHA